MGQAVPPQRQAESTTLKKDSVKQSDSLANFGRFPNQLNRLPDQIKGEYAGIMPI